MNKKSQIKILVISLFLIVGFIILVNALTNSPIMNNTVHLYSIELNAKSTLYYNEENSLIIQTKNINGSLVDVDKIVIYSSNYLIGNLIRTNVGQYSQSFIVNNTNVSSINFNVTAYEGEYFISKEIDISIINYSFIDNYFKKIKDYILHISNNSEEHLIDIILYITLFIFTVLTLIIFFQILRK